MTVFVSMLRGVNVGGHNKIKMEALRTLCGSLSFSDAQTLIQSGNVVFRAKEKDPLRVARKIGDAIEKKFKFRPTVIVRTTSELREAIAQNPFAARSDINPSKLLVTFLAADPGADKRGEALAMNVTPEEMHIVGRELYIYFQNGMGKTKLSMPKIEKLLQTAGTGRNWNTVQKLLAMAENLEAVH